MKLSVSLLCSPVKFCNVPSDNFLKKSNSVFTFHSPSFFFFLSMFLTITYSSPSMIISPLIWTLSLLENLLKTSSAFDVLVVSLKNKNNNKSTVKTVFPPKLGGFDSTTEIPLHLSKSIFWFSPYDKKLENSMFLIYHLLNGDISLSFNNNLLSTALSKLRMSSVRFVRFLLSKNDFTNSYW